MLPMAVPGLVLGLGYVFFINAKWNPLGVFYGTIPLLAVNSIAHFYTTAHITAVTALKQIDSEFEAVSASLKVPFYRTFARVTVPICMPAILDIAVYMFVNALTTVSAVIFLYGASNKLASISVVHMDEAGATAAAAAMATLIVLTALAVKGAASRARPAGVRQAAGPGADASHPGACLPLDLFQGSSGSIVL
jgi:iron(III) transport system permease protein